MNLYDLLDTTARESPEAEAVSCGGVRLSYAEFVARVRRLGNVLLAAGLERGDRVAILSPNCHTFLESYFAAAGADLVLVPVNIRLTARDLAFILDDSGARTLIAHPELRDLVEESGAENVLYTGPEHEAALRSAEDGALPASAAGEDIAQIYYTSGTTGTPKGVMLTHANVATHARAAIGEFRISGADVWAHVAPLFHLADAWACRFSFSVRPDIASFPPPGSRPINHSWYDNLGRRISLCFGGEITQDLTSMRALLLIISALLRCGAAFFRSRSQQAVVELALRQQLATYAQTGSKPRLTPLDRAFWVALFRFWPNWRNTLVIVKPDTVIRWYRKGFRLYWRAISKRGPGRPPIPDEVKALIRRLAGENDWRARKIHAELEKLGFTVGLATVSRYLPKRAPDPGKQQRWMTFLRNHKDGITAMDFFVVPTLGFRLLYVWFIIDHGRRRIIQFNVTTNPTAQWVIRQLREAFPYDSAPRYLIFDNDTIFAAEVSKSIKALGMAPKRTAYMSPWQNGVAERWVGSCKRELTDHVIVFNENHLRRLLRDYVSYYNAERVHTRLRDSPEGRAVVARPSSDAKAVGLSRVGRLHHRYVWQEAA